MMLYSAVSLRACQKEHWEKLIYWVGGWSNCLGPSQRVGWFWEIKSIIWQDTSIFSSAVLRQETQGLHPVNIPSFLLPYLLSLSDTSRLLVLTHTAGGMLTFLRGAVQPVTVCRARDIVQKRNSSIYSKPPKSKIGPGVSEKITKS